VESNRSHVEASRKVIGLRLEETGAIGGRGTYALSKRGRGGVGHNGKELRVVEEPR